MPDAAAAGEARGPDAHSRVPSREVGLKRRTTVRDLVPHTWCMAARGPRHHMPSMRRRTFSKMALLGRWPPRLTSPVGGHLCALPAGVHAARGAPALGGGGSGDFSHVFCMTEARLGPPPYKTYEAPTM